MHYNNLIVNQVEQTHQINEYTIHEIFTWFILFQSTLQANLSMVLLDLIFVNKPL